MISLLTSSAKITVTQLIPTATFIFLIKICSSSISTSQLNIFIFVNSLAPAFSLFDFGIGNLLLITEARNKSSSKKKSLEIFNYARKRLSAICIPLSCVFALLSVLRVSTNNNLDDTFYIILIYGLLAILNAPSQIIKEKLQATQQYSRALCLSILTSIFAVLITWLLLLSNATERFIYYTPIIASLTVNYFYTRKLTKIPTSSDNISSTIKKSKIYAEDRMKNLFKNARPYLITKLSILIQFQLDALLVAALITVDAAAQVALVQKIYAIPILIIGSILTYIFPIYASNIERNRSIETDIIVYGRKVAFILVALMLISSSMFWFCPYVLSNILSYKETVNTNILAAYSVYFVVNSLNGLVSIKVNALMLTNLIKKLAVYGLPINLCFGIFFTINYGASGPIMASTVCSILTITISLYYLKQARNAFD